jgi:hypothetical protein
MNILKEKDKMLDKYRLSNVDTFFITFIAAWCSTNKDLWNDPSVATALILFALSYTIILSQIRFRREKKGKKEEKALSPEIIFAFACIPITGYHLAINIGKSLTFNDIIVLAISFALWAAYSYLSLSLSNKAYVLTNMDDLEV